MALLHLVSGDASSAASSFNEAATKFDDPRSAMGLAVALAEAGRLNEAVKQCSLYIKRLMGRDSAPKLTEMLLASTLKTMGRFRAAASVYDHAIHGFPTDRDTARMYIELGFCYRSLGDSKKETDCIESAKKIAPDLVAEPAGQSGTQVSTRGPML